MPENNITRKDCEENELNGVESLMTLKLVSTGVRELRCGGKGRERRDKRGGAKEGRKEVRSTRKQEVRNCRL